MPSFFFLAPNDQELYNLLLMSAKTYSSPRIFAIDVKLSSEPLLGEIGT